MARYQLVSKEEYQHTMADVPLPSPVQYERFAQHLMDVHSWYKHLSLRYGGHFIVFLHSSAGAVYPTQHPSLPFGNHTEGYHKAFGYLSYMYVSNAHRKLHYSRDDEDTFRAGEVLVPLTADLLSTTGFVLYPYVNHNGYESILNGYADRQRDLEDWHNGVFTLPDQQLFASFVHLYQQTDGALNGLENKIYQEYIAASPTRLSSLFNQYPQLRSVKILQQKTQAAYESLRQSEYDKIMLALKNLQKYLKNVR
ncbi:hypothetical protein [uncultured Microscilla sp.]|uniref:hypothetical protein n=1 Tax=uncultured Microscilla sp. TaxID=432653 RepID=UPI002608BABA|nr:hypothetical protein [uncultured Microscilla sp.]